MFKQLAIAAAFAAATTSASAVPLPLVDNMNIAVHWDSVNKNLPSFEHDATLNGVLALQVLVNVAGTFDFMFEQPNNGNAQFTDYKLYIDNHVTPLTQSANPPAGFTAWYDDVALAAGNHTMWLTVVPTTHNAGNIDLMIDMTVTVDEGGGGGQADVPEPGTLALLGLGLLGTAVLRRRKGQK